MKATELRSKTVDELNQDLLEHRREEFNLRMQRGAGQLANPARFGIIRKHIARVKTILAEKSRGNE